MYTHYFSRWNNVLNPELRPKSWTYEEDKELLKLIQVYGIGEQLLFTTPGRRQSNPPILSRNVDQKSSETVFSIDICPQWGDKWQWKTLFLSILIRNRRLLITFLIAAYPVCLQQK